MTYRLLSLPALVLSTLPAFADVRLTIYDDGLSCPADCDAHVVFHRSLNGTAFAHDPATTSAPFRPCTNGQTCELCIDEARTQCFKAIYRGAGPTHNTFDLTPAFFDQTCRAGSDVLALSRKCAELQRAAATLAGRTNCIRTPDADACKSMMSSAAAAQATDRAAYDECKKLGERAFNASRPIAEQRSNQCAYEARGTGGPNSAGTTWRKLLPGACRAGTFVGRDGLDCCNGNPATDGPLGIECRAFYPRP